MGQCACGKLRLSRRKSKRARNNGRDPHYLSEPSNTDATRREEQQLSKSKAVIERLVNELVKKSTTLFNSDPNADAPASLLLLRRMSSESDDVLVEIQLALIRCIPLDASANPFYTNLLVLVLDECSLFSHDVLTRLIRELRLPTLLSDYSPSRPLSGSEVAQSRRMQVRRNVCVLIGTLAEKLAGPNSTALCTEEILDFLFDAVADCCAREADRSGSGHAALVTPACAKSSDVRTSKGKSRKANRSSRTVPDCDELPLPQSGAPSFRLDSARLNVVLHSLIALEKLAHANAANKVAILRRIYHRNAVHLTGLIRVVRRELERFHSHSPTVLSCDPLAAYVRHARAADAVAAETALSPDKWVSLAHLSPAERSWLADLRQVRFQCEWLIDNVFVRCELVSMNVLAAGQPSVQQHRTGSGSSGSSQKQTAALATLQPSRDALSVYAEQSGTGPTSLSRHVFLYELVDYSRLHARMRNNDISEYAKLDPLGFEVRSDHNGFETVRANFSVRRVCAESAPTRSCNAYYFEVVILTNGIMQIGWSTPSSEFHSREGFGVGDDRYSVAFDGCRQLIWFEAKAIAYRPPRAAASFSASQCVSSLSLPAPFASHSLFTSQSSFASQSPSPLLYASPSADHSLAMAVRHTCGDADGGWKAGDVLGSLLDLDGSFVAFYINGVEVTRVAMLFAHTDRDTDEYFAAASLMSFQQALFNLGQLPFLFTPGSCAFRSCFDVAREQFESTRSERERVCELEQRIVLPRPLLVRARLKQQLDAAGASGSSVESPKCSICFEALRPDTKCRLTPCGHTEICMTCAMQCELCPFCRTTIDERACCPTAVPATPDVVTRPTLATA